MSSGTTGPRGRRTRPAGRRVGAGPAARDRGPTGWAHRRADCAGRRRVRGPAAAAGARVHRFVCCRPQSPFASKSCTKDTGNTIGRQLSARRIGTELRKRCGYRKCPQGVGAFSVCVRRCPPSIRGLGSIIGAGRLSFRVRDGVRAFPCRYVRRNSIFLWWGRLFCVVVSPVFLGVFGGGCGVDDCVGVVALVCFFTVNLVVCFGCCKFSAG